MHQIKIKEQDLTFLETHVSNAVLRRLFSDARKTGTQKINNQYETNYYILFVSSNNQKLILDVLSDLLIKIGLQENDEPNLIGLKIEDLIDLFNVS